MIIQFQHLSSILYWNFSSLEKQLTNVLPIHQLFLQIVENFLKIQHHILVPLSNDVSKYVFPNSNYCKKLYSFYSCHACIDDVFFLLTFSHLLLLHSISLKYYFDRCIPLKSPYIYNKMRPHYTCLQVIKNSTPKYPLHTTYITLKI